MNEEIKNDETLKNQVETENTVEVEEKNQLQNTQNDKKSSSKNSKSIITIIGFIIVVLLSCLALWFVLEHKNKIAEEEISNEIIFDETTLPRVDASLATQPLMDAFVLNFTGKATTELGVEYTNTHPGYVKLINNETDLIIVTEPSAEELALAKEKGIELEVTKVVNEGFVFFVNVNNEVDDLTLEQVRSIYTGEITNWKELGGPDKEIVAYQRPVNSGSQTGLLSLVMNGKEVKIPTVKESVTLTMAGIVDYVADYDNGLDAIGFSYYYYANVMYKNDNLKYIAINGVNPSFETIRDGSYPLLSAYYIVTRKDETNENVLKLKENMLSKRGQKVASEAGYVPIK